MTTLEDLIRLGSKKRKRCSDYSKLKALVPELKALKNMVGMKEIKKAITYHILFYLQDLDNSDMLHTTIQGGAGVGKTELSKIIGRIYLKLGFLKNDKFLITKRSDLIGEYLGQTSIKTQRRINEANGGVLFIDEAYSLGNAGTNDCYSKECIDTLVSNLSENRGFVCIIAGYKEDLEKSFFSKNQGLKRRFPWTYNIADYNASELEQIFRKQAKASGWRVMIPKNFFEGKVKNFKYMGGDTEILLAKCKIAHSHRLFGKPKFMKKIININDIEKGYKFFKDYSNTRVEKPPPFGMYL